MRPGEVDKVSLSTELWAHSHILPFAKQMGKVLAKRGSYQILGLTQSFYFVKVNFVIKKAAFAVSITSVILLIQPVFALDSTTSSTTRTPTNIQQKIDTRKLIINTKIATKEANIASRETLFRQRLSEIKEKIASREAALKLKLQQFKDQQKANIAQKVNIELNKINQKRTFEMLKHLELMTNLLNKLEERITQNAPEIKNPDEAKLIIADARVAIADTTTDVQNQALKDYSLQATGETQIRAEAKVKRDQLFKDLEALRKKLIEDKQMVANAVRVAVGGPKIATPAAKIKEGTQSGH